MDMLAAQLGMDPVEVRRRNFIPHGRVPLRHSRRRRSTTAATTTPSSTRRWTTSATTTSAQSRQSCASAGPYLGIGLSTYVEICGIGPSAPRPRRRLGERHGAHRAHRQGDGRSPATSPHGQGSETTFAQIVAERPRRPDRRRRPCSTATPRQVPFGIGTFGSRAIGCRRRGR